MIMARETKAQKARRLSDALARYDELSKAKNKIDKDLKDLKAQLKAETPDTYGDWVLATGTPREILDQPAARKALTDNGIPVPMTTTEAPIVVRPK
jgi:hypothetical protein